MHIDADTGEHDSSLAVSDGVLDTGGVGMIVALSGSPSPEEVDEVSGVGGCRVMCGGASVVS